MKKWKHKRHNVPPTPPLSLYTYTQYMFHTCTWLLISNLIEVKISVEPFHPSSQVNGYSFAGINPRGVGSGTIKKTFSMGRLCITYNPLPFFCIPFLIEMVHVPHSVRLSFLAKSLPFHIQCNWSLRKVALLGGASQQSRHREYPSHCF